MLALRRFGGQSTCPRFFQGFRSAGKNLAAFGPMWRWCRERRPSRTGGYSLDLDPTRRLHEDGPPEGVAIGYTRLGTRPCLHPLLAVLEEVKLVAGCWWRPGNASCASHVVAFTQELRANLPPWIRMGLVRADSGFCLPEGVGLLAAHPLKYIVVARRLKPLQRRLKPELIWTPTDVPGTEAAEVLHQEIHWRQPRRVILWRHRLAEKKATGQRPGGKPLLDCPGYLYQGLVTKQPTSISPIQVWPSYNPRAGGEEVIKQLDMDFALPKLGLKSFWRTEAAPRLAILSYNLTQLFHRHLGWRQRVTRCHAAFPAFHPRRDSQSNRWNAPRSAGRAGSGRTGRVEDVTREDHPPDPQQPCSPSEFRLTPP